MYPVELPCSFDGEKQMSMGVKGFSSSKLSWNFHEVWILVIVSEVGPQTFRRWFQVPLMMVHPILVECDSVVRSSWVMTEDPSIISCHRSDFCCSCTHPRSFSPFGHGWLRTPCISWIFVFEDVILGWCWAIKGRGFGSNALSSFGSASWSGSSVCISKRGNNSLSHWRSFWWRVTTEEREQQFKSLVFILVIKSR
jgi:hypothetical protein